MSLFVSLALSLAAATSMSALAYPSCAPASARPGMAHANGQAHIAERANVLQADIGSARKAQRLPMAQADEMWKEVDGIRIASDRLTARQGFLSAAERATYDRQLDAVTARLCKAGTPQSYGNDALPSDQSAAFERMDAQLKYRDARIEYDRRNCTVYQGIAPNGRVKRLPLLDASGRRICAAR